VTARRSLLVVDDDRLFGEAVREDLEAPGLEVVLARSLADALPLCRERPFDVVLLDQQLPDGAGADLCPEILATNERAKVVFATAYPSFGNVVEALRRGAVDYLSKPCDPRQVRLVVERCLSTLDLERACGMTRRRKADEAGGAVLIGSDTTLAEVAVVVDAAAATDATVLVTGETGTGKGLVARAIHYRSARRDHELVAVNCAALPESLVEAELFGHERGAFTGAAASREGLFEMAEGGTLFLDEIAEMTPALQTRLLQVLEEKTVRRVGGRTPRRVDFRLIAATNADLGSAVTERRFRSDLYYRLDVIRIELPPLRQRRTDIPALARHLLRGLGAEESLPESELSRLSAYDWPGNVRELRNVLERTVLLHRGPGPLMPSRFLPSGSAPASAAGPDQTAASGLPLAEVEARHIAAELARLGGNLTRAARSLGISVSTLRRKVSETAPK